MSFLFHVPDPPFMPNGSPYAHWSADTILSGPGLLETWPDQAGSRDLLQPVEGNRPTFVENYYGALPAVQFTQAATSYMQVNYGGTLTSPITMFLVMKIDVDNTDSFFNAITSQQIVMTSSGGQFGLHGGNVVWTGYPPDTSATHLYTFFWNSAGRWDVDNELKFSADFGDNEPTGLTLGSSFFNPGTGSQLMTGHIMEFIVYEGDWYNAGKKDFNAAGLMSKWGI